MTKRRSDDSTNRFAHFGTPANRAAMKGWVDGRNGKAADDSHGWNAAMTKAGIEPVPAARTRGSGDKSGGWDAAMASVGVKPKTNG